MPLLHIENLSVKLVEDDDDAKIIIDRLSLRMSEGETLGIVGESGSGKSVLALAIMGLLSSKMKVTADYFSIDGHDLMKMNKEERRAFVSSKASLIFQDPKSSLDPSFSVGAQLDETIELHSNQNYACRKKRAVELLLSVGIRNPEKLLNFYPHQLSGGMSQRVAIALALACNPRLLIADEPTTALDVTVQAQILQLLVELSKNHGVGVILITHDFALLSENTDKIGVVYAGQLLEHAATSNILQSAIHPYTKALLDSVPQLGKRHTKGSRLFALKGQIPQIGNLPVGCRLGPRCPNAEKQCVNPPQLISIKNHGKVRCHLASQIAESILEAKSRLKKHKKNTAPTEKPALGDS